jgi:hypothetical protein
MFEMIHSLAVKNTNLRQTRDLLLPKLISGEVTVTGVDAVDNDYKVARKEEPIAKAAEAHSAYATSKKGVHNA